MTQPALAPSNAANSPQDLSGKVALITGGARGIGQAVARLFVAQHATVIVADLLELEGESLAAELGPAAHFRLLDVTDEADWIGAVGATSERFGGVDILVNCAGILVVAPIVELDRRVYEKVLQINLVGTFLGIKHVARAIRERGGGSIINLSSTEGLQGSSFMGAYASSKWGVRGLTKVAAMELGPWNIRVNSLHPGPVNTPMVNPQGRPADELESLSMLDLMPIRRVAEPVEIAYACLYLASDASAFVTGAEIAIDGGLSLGMFTKDKPET